MIVKYGRTSMTTVDLSLITSPTEDVPVDAKAKPLLCGYENIQTAAPVTFERTFTCFAPTLTEFNALKALRGVKGYLYIVEEAGGIPEERYGIVIMSLRKTWNVGGWDLTVKFQQSV